MRNARSCRTSSTRPRVRPDDEVRGFAFNSFSSPLAANIGRGIGMTSEGATVPYASQPGRVQIDPGKLRAKINDY
jgi:hypothetical protein